MALDISNVQNVVVWMGILKQIKEDTASGVEQKWWRKNKG